LPEAEDPCVSRILVAEPQRPTSQNADAIFPEDRMKSIKLVALPILLILVGGALVAQAHEHPVKTEHPSKTENAAQDGDILSVASEAGDFKSFLAAVEAAGLMEKLHGKGPFTVFVPTDAAFAQLPEGTMEELLKPANKARLAGLLANHVVPGVIMSADVKTMKATNVSGQDLHLKVDDGTVCVNNARTVKADMVCTNGVIYAIDTVIIPVPSQEKVESEKPKDHPAH
jgi:uncharacterized surface protein with fasciclin (FAS1) repeats